MGIVKNLGWANPLAMLHPTYDAGRYPVLLVSNRPWEVVSASKFGHYVKRSDEVFHGFIGPMYSNLNYIHRSAYEGQATKAEFEGECSSLTKLELEFQNRTSDPIYTFTSNGILFTIPFIDHLCLPIYRKLSLLS